MYIEDCIKKEIFGSLERNKLPNNLQDYYCELCIEQYEEGKTSEEVRYFHFTPRAGVKAEPFSILIDSIAKPSNLIYSYRIIDKEPEKGVNPELIIGNKIQYKFQTTVVQPRKPQKHIQNLSEPDSEEVLLRNQDRFLQNLIQLQDSNQEDNGSGESKCVEPSEGEKGNIKTELVHYLHVEDNKFSKIKEVKTYLLSKGHKISDNGLKILLGEICKTNPSDKKSGLILKDQYYSKEEFDKRNPKKRVKEE